MNDERCPELESRIEKISKNSNQPRHHTVTPSAHTNVGFVHTKNGDLCYSYICTFYWIAPACAVFCVLCSPVLVVLCTGPMCTVYYVLITMLCSMQCSALCPLYVACCWFNASWCNLCARCTFKCSVCCCVLLCVAVCCCVLCAAGPISEAASDQRRPPTALTLSHCPQNISAGKSRGKPKFSTEKMNADHAVTRESSMLRIFFKICNLTNSAKNKWNKHQDQLQNPFT